MLFEDAPVFHKRVYTPLICASKSTVVLQGMNKVSTDMVRPKFDIATAGLEKLFASKNTHESK